MDLTIISVPYDSGTKGMRMGMGPIVMAERYLSTDHCGKTEVKSIVLDEPFPTEIGTAFSVCRALSLEVSGAISRGRFPIVLAGNCNTALGTTSGMGGGNRGLFWFDGHGDFNTPETTKSGYLDGMGLAMTTGLCFRNLAPSIPGYSPVPFQNAVHVGGGDIEEQEAELMKEKGVARIHTENVLHKGITDEMTDILPHMATCIDALYVHIDVDILDPVHFPSNQFPVKSGISSEDVKEGLSLIFHALPVKSLCISSYDPSYDPQKNTLEAAMDFIKRVESLVATW